MNDETQENKVVYLRVDDIIPNRFQPREVFDETGLQELADSIKEHGVIQPIIVRQFGDKYELIAGERRTKASSLAGLTTIPAIIRNMDDKESAKVSLLENLQRKNLSAIEEARTYKRILELDNMTQEELARTMGRSQPMVANKLRLLSLPEEIQDALMKNQISERHARSLLNVKNKKDQLDFLNKIKNERLTVRELDALIKEYKENMENASNEIEKSFNERSTMNNNRSNFGGMGLNDYQSSINNNFNNIPNNFNNMPNNMNSSSTMPSSFDYNTSDTNANFQTNNNFLEQSISNNQSSLGSMFDGLNQSENSNFASSNENSNLFVSHIREDNLPKKENQFLPNFDDLNSTPNENFNNNQFEMNNNFNQMDLGSGMNNNFNQMDLGSGMNNNFNQMDSGSGMNNNFNQMDLGYGMNNNFSNNSTGFDDFLRSKNLGGEATSSNNSNYFMNDLNVSNQQEVNSNYNNSSMNNFEFQNNEIPDISMAMSNSNPSISNSNGYLERDRGLFDQPLNIVDIPKNDQNEYNDNSLSSYSTVDSKENEIGSTENINENPFDDAYENILFAKPVPVQQDEVQVNKFSEENQELEEKNVEISEAIKDTSSSNSDIEIIGEVDQEIEKQNLNSDSNDSAKNEYISLEPVITIKNTMDAVLELKKTTDKIKQNNIDIETEEIDFEDVYQITIKIKKD